MPAKLTFQVFSKQEEEVQRKTGSFSVLNGLRGKKRGEEMKEKTGKRGNICLLPAYRNKKEKSCLGLLFY